MTNTYHHGSVFFVVVAARNGSAHGICWQCNTKEHEQNKCYHDMHIWLEESSMVNILHKAIFSLQQRNKFYLTIMVVVKH